MNRLSFEKKSDRCYVAFLEKDRNGKTITVGAVRAIREGDIWRIDRADAIAGAWLPWEPINETEYATADLAMDAIRSEVRK